MKKSMIVALVAMSLALMLGGIAIAATTTGSGNPLSTNQTVTVAATANPKLMLTLDTNAVDFGAQDPGTPVTINGAVNITVQSNKAYTLTKSVTDPGGQMGLSTSLAASTAGVKGTNPYADNYTINIPWTTDPGAITGSEVVYTVTQ